MLPLALDPSRTKCALAGNGALALRRMRALRGAGATELLIFTQDQDPALTGEAGNYFQAGLPDEAALADLQLLWIVGLAPQDAATLAAKARRLRVLVNVEDVPELCDFHSVAEVRRGDLLLTVSTNGAAPGLAGTIRRRLENCFPPEWADHVNEIASLRQGWRAEGVPMAEAAKRIEAIVDEQCWLTCPRPN